MRRISLFLVFILLPLHAQNSPACPLDKDAVLKLVGSGRAKVSTLAEIRKRKVSFSMDLPFAQKINYLTKMDVEFVKVLEESYTDVPCAVTPPVKRGAPSEVKTPAAVPSPAVAGAKIVLFQVDRQRVPPGSVVKLS